jgi:hypothetical protein
MSSDQSDIVKEMGGIGGNGGGAKGFPRSPLDYGSGLLGAGSPSYESRLPFKRSNPLTRDTDF